MGGHGMPNTTRCVGRKGHLLGERERERRGEMAMGKEREREAVG